MKKVREVRNAIRGEVAAFVAGQKDALSTARGFLFSTAG